MENIFKNSYLSPAADSAIAPGLEQPHTQPLAAIAPTQIHLYKVIILYLKQHQRVQLTAISLTFNTANKQSNSKLPNQPKTALDSKHQIDHNFRSSNLKTSRKEL